MQLIFCAAVTSVRKIHRWPVDICQKDGQPRCLKSVVLVSFNSGTLSFRFCKTYGKFLLNQCEVGSSIWKDWSDAIHWNTNIASARDHLSLFYFPGLFLVRTAQLIIHFSWNLYICVYGFKRFLAYRFWYVVGRIFAFVCLLFSTAGLWGPNRFNIWVLSSAVDLTTTF